MLSLSFLLIFFVIILHKSDAVSNADLQKLCAGKRYGTLVPNPNDCNSFYVCQFIVQLTKCDIGLHFDRKHKVCNWPQFAGCDWVEPEGSTSEEIVTPVRPNKPNTNDDKYPADRPNKPSPSEEGNGEKPSEESDKPNETSEHKPSEGGNAIQPSEDKEPEESKPGGFTVNDLITPKPQLPAIDLNNSSEESQDNQQQSPSTVGDMIIDGIETARPPSGPSTVGDMIIDEIETPRPPFGPSTVGDMIIDEIETPSPPSGPSTVDDVLIDELNTPSAENQDNLTVGDMITEPIPDLPKPNHPQLPPAPPIISEETDQESSEGNQNSSEKLPPIEGDNSESPKPPNIDENENVNKPDPEGSIDLSTVDGQSHHWNLIASIVSVESSHTGGGYINHSTVGAHSPQTGYPVNPMTGYNPNNVQCLYAGFYFLPHPTNCQKYYICAYRHLHLHSCGDGVMWNHKREMCDLKGNARCYSRDAESEDTTKLATPFIDDKTEKPTRKTTRRPATKTTKLPAATTVSHKLPICPATRQVYMPNLDDCHKYYICIMGKAVLTSCPSGMYWDAVGEFCGPPSSVNCVYR